MGHSESLVCPRREVKGRFSLMASQRDDTSCHIQVATETNHCKLWGGGWGGEKNQILRSRCCREASHVDKEREEPASWPLFLGLLAPRSRLHLPTACVVYPMSFPLCLPISIPSARPSVPFQEDSCSEHWVYPKGYALIYFHLQSPLCYSKGTVRVNPGTKRRMSLRALLCSPRGPVNEFY